MMMRRPQVERLTTLSRSSIYAYMAAGQFPRPVRIGRRAVAWRLADIEQWLAARATALPEGDLPPEPPLTAG